MPETIHLDSNCDPLSEKDYAALEARWITREIADGAYLRHVDSHPGAQLVGQEGRAGDYSGIAIPYLWPGTGSVVMYRLRREHPEMYQGSDGRLKPLRKYLSPPGGSNRLYLAPQTGLPQLTDVNLPLVITEGEFKTLALWRLSWPGLGDTAETPGFVPVGLQGVWNWRGTVGKGQDQDGTRIDTKGPIPDLARIAWEGRSVLILFDADIEKNFSLVASRKQLTEDLESRGAIVSWFIWPTSTPPEQKGIDDYLAANGPERVVRLLAKAKVKTRKRRAAPPTAAAALADGEEWRMKLLRGDKGIKPLLANALTALREAPLWTAAVRYNEFAMRAEVVDGTPWRDEPYLWADTDDTLLAEWLQREGIEVSETIANHAIEAVAREHGYHSVRDYLDELVWDGTKRIDTWLQDYMGADNGKNDDGGPSDRARYISAVGARWLISAVARVMNPGCQVDYALVFQGLQGKGKSSVLRALAGRDEWFTDNLGELGTTDSKIQLRGKWLVELAELSQVVGKRAEMETVKGFISTRYDNYRPPYGRRAADFPRHCVFAGSTNADQYLRDETGNRRFWPVSCPFADVAGVAAVKDQLWAEARARWELKEKWWLHEPDLIRIAEEEQDARFDRDPWEEPVWAYVVRQQDDWQGGGKPLAAFTITMEQILGGALAKKTSEWTRQDKTRVSAILRRRGLEYKRERVYDLDGKPVKDPNGEQSREYHFRWPSAKVPKK